MAWINRGHRLNWREVSNVECIFEIPLILSNWIVVLTWIYFKYTIQQPSKKSKKLPGGNPNTVSLELMTCSFDLIPTSFVLQFPIIPIQWFPIHLIFHFISVRRQPTVIRPSSSFAQVSLGLSKVGQPIT